MTIMMNIIAMLMKIMMITDNYYDYDCHNNVYDDNRDQNGL